MCGAYGFSVKDAREVYNRFDITNTLENFKPRWNVRPGQMNPVITMQEHIEIRYMFWGLIPHWAKERNFKFSTINSRDDRVMESSVYKQSFLKRRAAIPATGFYEPDKKHVSKPPYPWHYFTVKDQPLFAFAGLYDIWKDKETGKELYSYTIMTTAPNSVVGTWHERMPVILPREQVKKWLDPDITEPEHILPLLKPYPANQMEEWQVGDAARNPRNDYPELIERYKANQQGSLLQ